MSRTVWKYPLAIADSQEVEVGGSPRFLHAAMQDGHPTLWVECATTFKEPKPWFVSVVPTGGIVGTDSEYLGTCVGQQFVWHIYRTSRRPRD